MTASFPTDKTQPFVADNGVTYYWDSDRWRVKQYKLDDAALEDYATEQWTEEKIADAILDGTVDLTGYATVVYSDAEDQELQNQIDELGVTKGKVARYTTINLTGSPASRPGDLAVNASDPTAVVLVSFGTEDADGVLTKPMAVGDIIEFVDAVNGNVSRYRITDADAAPTYVSVEYVSGDNDFVVGEEEQVYIYPQNASGASKDYVDAQDDLKLNLTGGNLSGELVSKTGTSSINAFTIKNQSDNETSLKIWSPGGSGTEVKYVGRNNTQQWFQSYNSGNAAVTTTAKFAYQNYSFAAQNNVTYGASDAHYFKSQVFFVNGSDETKVTISNKNSDFYNLPRFKDGFVVKAKNEPITGDNSFAAYPDHTSYSGRQTEPTDIVNKEYVDSVAGGVPIGTVVMWFGETAPTGWLICDGSGFDINTYPALHAHLQTVRNYKTGITPNFQGLYPGGAGVGHDNSLTLGGESKTNVYHSQRTAAPNGGNPTSLAEIPDGTTRTFNGSGGTNAYSNGISRVNISEGWDNVTRPPTLAVHFIIKA